MDRLCYFLAIACLGTMTAFSQSNVTHTLMQDTLQRSFIVHIPTGYDPSVPVSCVFNLHGAGMTGSYQQLYTKMDAVSNANGFLVVYPNGIDNSWLVGSTGQYSDNTRDVQFISAILDTLIELYNVNTDRVFACGLSQGGYMSHRLACDLQNRFAAIASVAGGISDSARLHCQDLRKVPVLFIHGTDDAFVPYTWGASAMDFWIGRNICDPSPVVTDLPDNNTSDNSTVRHIVYNACSAHVAVEMFRVEGGGHTWPGPFLNLTSYGTTNYDISASQEIWKFFNRFSIHGSVAGAEEKAIQLPEIFPNPASQEIHIKGIELSSQIFIFDTFGKLVHTTEGAEKIDISMLPAGVYSVKIGETSVRKLVITRL